MLHQPVALSPVIKSLPEVVSGVTGLTSLSNIVEMDITRKEAHLSKVFLLDTNKKSLDPIEPGYARKLLGWGKAAVFKRYPFTLILKEACPEATPEPLRLKLDSGSKTTGLALVNDSTGEVVFAAELTHRGQAIKNSLDSRRALRRNRRNRKTRYRPARFLNRTKPKGWLPPSLNSRLENVMTWVRRLYRLCPITALSMELVRFDTQLMASPEISGVEYQQGELQGYEVRHYLLEKWGRKCAYCGVENVPFELEHINPRSRGGSNRVSNLAIACHKCNQAKGNQTAAEYGHPEVQAKAKLPLKDAAAVNATRWALFERLKATGLELETGSGGLTKFNRTKRELPKTHWLDAACVGKSTPLILKVDRVRPLRVMATGRGLHSRTRSDKYGFPRLKLTRQKRHFGFQTGDMARAEVTSGSKQGVYTGKVAVRSSGSFNLTTATGVVSSISHRFFKLIHRADGYSYQTV